MPCPIHYGPSKVGRDAKPSPLSERHAYATRPRGSPELMDKGPNLGVVDFADACHDFRSERGKIGRPRVVRYLAGALATGDRATDRIEHQDPAQSKLAHADVRRYQGADFFDRRQRHLVINPGEGLAYIETLALAVEVAMIVGIEFGIGAKLPRKQPAGQRNARQDANLLQLGLGKEEFRRTLTETIENDLHRLQVGVFHGLESLFHALHAHPIETDLARLHQVVEHGEDLGMIIGIGRRAVELHQVEDFYVQIEQVVFDPGGKVSAGVALNRLLGQTPAHLGGYDDVFFAGLLQLPNQAMTAAIAIDIRSIEKVDAG